MSAEGFLRGEVDITEYALIIRRIGVEREAFGLELRLGHFETAVANGAP